MRNEEFQEKAANLLLAIAAKKERLAARRPVSQAALLALQHSYDVELTYTSNAIEGNTLTWRETAELIEHGITVGGKPLRDHDVVRNGKVARWTPALPRTGLSAPPHLFLSRDNRERP